VQTVHLIEVSDACTRLVVQSTFLVGVRGELALDAAHAGNHGVKIA
jgi:hypothetical protein